MMQRRCQAVFLIVIRNWSVRLIDMRGEQARHLRRFKPAEAALKRRIAPGFFTNLVQEIELFVSTIHRGALHPYFP